MGTMLTKMHRLLLAYNDGKNVATVQIKTTAPTYDVSAFLLGIVKDPTRCWARAAAQEGRRGGASGHEDGGGEGAAQQRQGARVGRPARGHARQGAHDAPWSRCERVEHAVGDCCACGAHFSGGMCLEKNDKKSAVFSAILGDPPPISVSQYRYLKRSIEHLRRSDDIAVCLVKLQLE